MFHFCHPALAQIDCLGQQSHIAPVINLATFYQEEQIKNLPLSGFRKFKFSPEWEFSVPFPGRRLLLRCRARYLESRQIAMEAGCLSHYQI